MTARTRIIVAGIVTMLCSSIVTAADHDWRGGASRGWILRQLGLTDTQKAQLKRIVANHRGRLQSLREQIGAEERQLRHRIYSPNPPSAADLAPVMQLRGQLAQERLQMALEIRTLLTPDQLAKAQQIRQQMDALQAQMRALVNTGP